VLYYRLSSYCAVDTSSKFQKEANSKIMLYRKIIAVYAEIQTEQVNTLCGLNVEFLTVKDTAIYIGIYIDHWTMKKKS